MDLIGKTLNQYKIIELIGQGGMATVYKAYQPGLDRHVAIKVLPAHHTRSRGFKERFVREAKAIAQLDHPNILPIYDVNLLGEISYFVMRFVPGRSLKQGLGQPLVLANISHYLDQIAAGLDHAHGRGILHRDIKPANILLDEAMGWVLLADFGLAKLLEGHELLTNTGEMMGTPAYMSPEQAQGLVVDHRTDIYSLGIVLYEMIAGRVPYKGETPLGLVYKHIHEPPPPPRQFRADLPGQVEQVVLKALAKAPADRFAQATDLADAFRQAVEGQASAAADDSLTDATRSISMTRLREGGQLTPAVNPYTARAVIKEATQFVGRTAELRDLYTLLAGLQSCSIVGPRRIGKSSLLYQLTQPTVYPTFLPQADRYVLAYMDLQELAGLGPNDFCEMAVERLGRAGQGRLEVDPARDGTMAGIRRFLMRVTDADQRLVLCCDEFEMLSQNANFGADFFTYLRGLCSNYNLALITSSRASLFDLCHLGNLQTSQFWNIFTERTLGLMADEEARTLISGPFTQAGGTMTEDGLAFILQLAGRHPFFIQIACYHHFAAGSAPDRAALEAAFYEEAQRHYAYAWQQLDPPDLARLADLAQDQPLSLEARDYNRLQRMALLTGTPQSPALVSAGWHRFIRAETGRGASESASQAKLAPSPAGPPVAVEADAGSEYLDFALKLEPLDATRCRVTVLDSPAGQDSVICTLPFDLDTVGGVMVDLGQQLTRGSRPAPAGPSTPMTMGEGLFKAIFSGPVSQLFFESLGRIQAHDQGLRLKIHVDPANASALAALPWEFLYNDRRRQYLGLSRLTPIVRYLDVQAPTTPAQIDLPLRVLVVIAAPNGLPPLNQHHERQLIGQAWGNRPEVALKFLEPATPSALQALLWDWQPHLLHFIGHGQFEPESGAGTLLLVDDQGDPKAIDGSQLGGLLANVPALQLAFLNACQSAELTRSRDLDPFSGVAAALVMAGLPAVVAMQFPITDAAALAFANGFYPRLAAGDAVERAVSFGREAIRLELRDNDEWGTPVLFMRVPHGRLFEISKGHGSG